MRQFARRRPRGHLIHVVQPDMQHRFHVARGVREQDRLRRTLDAEAESSVVAGKNGEPIRLRILLAGCRLGVKKIPTNTQPRPIEARQNHPGATDRLVRCAIQDFPSTTLNCSVCWEKSRTTATVSSIISNR